jgi:hypothetical protein
MFDTNNDGYLSPEEKKRCHDALLKDNLEENYVFCMENKRKD